MDVRALTRHISYVRAAALVGLAALAVVTAPAVSGQSSRQDPNADIDRRFNLLRSGGSSIGASVRDLEDSEVKGGGGVYVASVRPESPAAKAGLQEADIITRFDGESIRSVLQFSRLVRETPPGRTVKASVLREGRATELTLTPEARANAGVFIDGDRLGSIIDEQRLQERLDEARDRISRIPFDLDLDFDFNPGAGMTGRSRLGVTVQRLSPQLATYFGAKDGVLVSTVVEDSAASRAGLKAGDVIVSVNGQSVTSSGDLMRGLRSAAAGTDTTIGIVRDKKEMSVKARLEDLRTRRPGRPVRPVSATPA